MDDFADQFGVSARGDRIAQERYRRSAVAPLGDGPTILLITCNGDQPAEVAEPRHWPREHLT